jgi:hypothetical protein
MSGDRSYRDTAVHLEAAVGLLDPWLSVAEAWELQTLIDLDHHDTAAEKLWEIANARGAEEAIAFLAEVRARALVEDGEGD